MSATVAGWLLTYVIHSTLLIGLAWLVGRRLSDRRLALREAIWRIALIGGLITSGAQTLGGIEPWSASWSLAASERPMAAGASAGPSAGSLLPSVHGRFSEAPAGHVEQLAATRPQLERWVVTGWLVGAAVLLTLLCLAYLRLRRRLRGRETVASGRLARLLERLRGEARARAVRLSRAAQIGVPLARGVRRWEICLPTGSFDRLPPERQEIVLAHELAHLRRYDPLWFAIHRSIERLFFFQPLNVIARRQLREIAEFRCDDWAVEITRRPISLARCLTEVAGWNIDRQGPLPAPTMAASKTQLGRRVARLLNRSYPMPNESLPRWIVPAAIVCLIVTALVAPGVSSRPSEAAPFDPGAFAHEPPPPATAEEPPPPVAPRAPADPEAPAPVVTRLDPEAPEPSLRSPVGSSAVLAPPPPPAPPGLPAVAPLPPRPALAPFGPLPLEAGLAGLAEDLVFELEGEWEPTDAELADLAGELAEGLELDEGALAALAHRAEQFGLDERRRAELERFSAELTESRPTAEQMERLRTRARELAERHARLSETRRQRLRELSERERAALERVEAEVRRSLHERREVIERARAQRLEALDEMSEVRRREQVEALRRAREELQEQLRRIEQELALEDEGRDPEIPE